MSRTSNKKKASKKKLTPKRIALEILYFAIMVFFVLAFRSTFFEPFHIPSGSMIPTLNIGDFILVNKFSYGFKIPYSDWSEKPIYISKPKMPKRGEVFIFKYPEKPKVNFIKRVMAVPGDTIEIIDGKIYINDEPLTRMEIPPDLKRQLWSKMVERFRRIDLDVYYETNGEHTYLIQQERNHNNWPINTRDLARTIVPENMYFAMGDNRDFSQDSRFWGFVPFNYVKGKAMFVWFSLTIPWIDETDNWLLRLDRIGTSIK